MDRVSNSRSRALVFGCFSKPSGLLKRIVKAWILTKSHCLGAEFLAGTISSASWFQKPIRNNHFFPDGFPKSTCGSSFSCCCQDAYGITNAVLDALNENPETVKLLDAICVTEFDLLKSLSSPRTMKNGSLMIRFSEIYSLRVPPDLNQIGYP